MVENRGRPRDDCIADVIWYETQENVQPRTEVSKAWPGLYSMIQDGVS